jgi:hypothetical protein
MSEESIQKYKSILEKGYREYSEFTGSNKFVYLSEEIFDFTTYDENHDSFMVDLALGVCVAISKKETHFFIKDEERRLFYTLMVNNSFFKDRLNWGTSIRYPWWDFSERPLKINSIDKNNNINEKEWVSLIEAIGRFLYEDDKK